LRYLFGDLMAEKTGAGATTSDEGEKMLAREVIRLWANFIHSG